MCQSFTQRSADSREEQVAASDGELWLRFRLPAGGTTAIHARRQSALDLRG
jgi:hypothetical protein